jgi:ATP-dependent protease ClpP protease subunit
MSEVNKPGDERRTAESDQSSEVISHLVPEPTKTPFYQAVHAARYQRQAIIREIQKKTSRRLICYVSGQQASIDRDDTIGFVDLLHNVPDGTDLDVLLHTGGGDIDAAEKLVNMVRTKVGNSALRIIVPDFAKSAGTLMVLGADAVVMSDTSELGPIDPQITLADGNGNRIRHSVQSYLDAYESLSDTLRKQPNDVPSQIMLGKLDPATVKLFEAVRHRARRFAETQLQKGMFRNGGNWSQTAGELLDTKRWQSHAQMISWQDAQDTKIGLKVEYLEPESESWHLYWELYCLQRLAVGDRQKLFESDYVSLSVDISAT